MRRASYKCTTVKCRVMVKLPKVKQKQCKIIDPVLGLIHNFELKKEFKLWILAGIVRYIVVSSHILYDYVKCHVHFVSEDLCVKQYIAVYL